MFTVTRVVSRNFVMDVVARFQNLVGLNLTSYELMVDKGIRQIREELLKRKVVLKWYRLEITQMTSGAVLITLYGDEEVV